MKPLLPMLSLLGLLLAGTAASADDDQEAMRQLRAAGAIVPLEQLLDDARRRHPGRVLEAELKRRDHRYIYEMEILGADGVVRELYYDAESGKLLDERTDD